MTFEVQNVKVKTTFRLQLNRLSHKNNYKNDTL